ncbi:LysR family transcriptional regulator [Candidimonas sp. SYP-B2681]|uniref:LysR family transcriptional regulator n=1 Tax=Candidimonas sp. SYP-B2681 TaxID=2497686 RepID=UPI000F89BFB9|nr:LysR family transcriptional regulator [Candidimonas sp. SYP-B2681]RTZ41583.1 LysR family transcriptional regulator [Candidimonas sp. SYP-B2681]
MNVERVTTFLAVAKHNGFREAAKYTGLSQSSVTQHVRRLEETLNVILIERNHAGSVLTPEGRVFLPYAENLVKAHARACTVFDNNKLIVGASSNTGIYLLPPYLKAFMDTLPHTVDVVIGNNPSMVEKLQNFEIDVAIMEWWDPQPGFSAALWRREDLVLIVPPGHRWAGMPSITREFLHDQVLLGGEAGSGTGRLLGQYFGEYAKKIGTSLQLGSTEAVKHAVQAGLGISLVMAACVVNEIRSGLLCAIPFEGKPLQKELYVICREYARKNAATGAFVHFMLSHNVDFRIPEH